MLKILYSSEASVGFCMCPHCQIGDCGSRLTNHTQKSQAQLINNQSSNKPTATHAPIHLPHQKATLPRPQRTAFSPPLEDRDEKMSSDPETGVTATFFFFFDQERIGKRVSGIGFKKKKKRKKGLFSSTKCPRAEVSDAPGQADTRSFLPHLGKSPAHQGSQEIPQRFP